MELLNIYAIWMNLMLYVSKRELSLALSRKMFKITDATLSKNKCRAQIDWMWERQNEKLMRTWLSAGLIQSILLSLGNAPGDAFREGWGWCSMLSGLRFSLLSSEYLSFSLYKLPSFWNWLEFFSLFNFLDLYLHFISQPDCEFLLK